MNKVDELGDDVDPTAPMVAEEVLKAVASHTRKYQQRLKPPPPDASNIRLTVLADLFKGLARGEAGVPLFLPYRRPRCVDRHSGSFGTRPNRDTSAHSRDHQNQTFRPVHGFRQRRNQSTSQLSIHGGRACGGNLPSHV